MIERRRFFRVVFSTPAEMSQNGQVWSTRLLDLSLQGALVEKPENWPAATEGHFMLSFCLADSDIRICMEVEPSHVGKKNLGLYCHHIDIDSASHLKRLIELNVGNADMLQRELAHLIEDHIEHDLNQL